MLATGEDPSDPQSWSGIPFSMRQALERRVERVTIFRPPPPARNPLDLALRLALGARRYPLWITRATLRANARALRAAVAEHQPQAVLSIASMCVVALGDPPVPTFLFSDAPYEAYHEAYRGTVDRPLRLPAYQREEAVAARKLDGLCYSSAWAVEQAQRLFGLQGRLHVTEMGSNWVPNLTREELLARVDARPTGPSSTSSSSAATGSAKAARSPSRSPASCNEQGIPARLHVVGCRPDVTLDYVEIHGPLYRTNPCPGRGPRPTLFLELALPPHTHLRGVLRPRLCRSAILRAPPHLPRRARAAVRRRRRRNRHPAAARSRGPRLRRPHPRPARGPRRPTSAWPSPRATASKPC